MNIFSGPIIEQILDYDIEVIEEKEIIFDSLKIPPKNGILNTVKIEPLSKINEEESLLAKKRNKIDSKEPSDSSNNDILLQCKKKKINDIPTNYRSYTTTNLKPRIEDIYLCTEENCLKRIDLANYFDETYNIASSNNSKQINK